MKHKTGKVKTELGDPRKNIYSKMKLKKLDHWFWKISRMSRLCPVLAFVTKTLVWGEEFSLTDNIVEVLTLPRKKEMIYTKSFTFHVSKVHSRTLG